MSKLNELFNKKLNVVNFGIESFYEDLKKQNVEAIHVDWKPVAGGDKDLANMLSDLI
ncbi:MAG: fdrA domain protein [Eubacteriales bacterium]|nr:fdrA domain protein [Eubacteriales bacterium]